MKLCHFGEPGRERAGVVTQAGRLEVGGFVERFDAEFWADDGPRRLRDWLEQHAAECPVVPGEVRVGAAILAPSKLVCVGRNYHEHAAEMGAEPPKEPLLFMKAPSAIVGPNDDLMLPRGSEKTDWEVELGVVIGRVARYVERDQALEHVAGYVLINDVSERDFQKGRGGQWVKGKSADTFAPVGPFVSTPDQLDPADLRLWLRLNGELMQDDRTSRMLFDVATLVSYVSEFMTLCPGDLISTGTPSGVGAGRQPPRYLRAGDVVECGIDGLGESRRRVVAFAPPRAR